MPCPNCGSNELWDDNLAWGCSRCKWFTTGGVRNTTAEYDNFNRGLPEHQWSGPKATNRVYPPPRLTPEREEDEEPDW